MLSGPIHAATSAGQHASSVNISHVIKTDKSHEKEVLPGTVHYLPHKEVVKEDRATTKLRIVYDASAKSRNEPSLNDCLLPGPALTPLIFDILLRLSQPRGEKFVKAFMDR